MNNILDEIKKNSNVRSHSHEIAVKSDEVFKKISKAHNLTIQKTPDAVDIFDHIDYYMTHKGVTFGIDIKSSDRVLQESATFDINNEWIWIEIKNVNGKTGWLYGKADYIVYVFNEEMWFINKRKLVNLVEKKTEDVYVTDKNEAKYKLYQRLNRKDLLTKANLGDILKELKPTILKINS